MELTNTDIDIEAWIKHEFEKPCEVVVHFSIGLGKWVFSRVYSLPRCRNKAEFLAVFSPSYEGCSGPIKRRFVCKKHARYIQTGIRTQCENDKPAHFMNCTFIGRS